MTSHNTFCLFHLLRFILSNYSRPDGCPIICPGHSRFPGVLLCLIHHSCPASSVFDLFSLLSYPSILSYRLKVKFCIWSYRPTGTAHAYFKVRAPVTMLSWTHSSGKLMVIIYQNDEKEISSQNLVALLLV